MKKQMIILAIMLVAGLFAGCSQLAAKPSESPDIIAEAPVVETPAQSNPTPAPVTPENSYPDGTFEGAGEGMDGKVAVSVTVSGGNITEVAVTEHRETEGIGTLAIDQIPPAIVTANSPDVDTVTGATITSDAIIEGVKEALGLD